MVRLRLPPFRGCFGKGFAVVAGQIGGEERSCAGAQAADAPELDLSSAPGAEALRAVSLVGETLAPLFLVEPGCDDVQAQLRALEAADACEFAEGWPFALEADVRRAIGLMQQGLAEPREGLIWEFRRLFIGPGHLVAPPWGSTYTDRDGVVFGDSHTRLVEFMRGNGIIRRVDEHTPVDHIGLMLHLMAWIADNRPEVLREYLSKHLLTWSSHFLEGLALHTESAFYQGLALLTRTTLEGIGEVFAVDVEYPRYVR